MTTAFPQHARGDALARGWRAFRRWRRSRPFWGGLFTVLGGLEIFATTQMSLGGLTFQMGPTGFLSWLVPTILTACGLLMWFTPQQRMFYAIVGAMTAVYSLIGVNLGGFFLGLLLGLVGTALGFAWTPVRPAAAVEPAPEPGEAGGDQPGSGRYVPGQQASGPHTSGQHGPGQRGRDPRNETTVDDLLAGPMSDTLPPAYNPLREGGQSSGYRSGGASGYQSAQGYESASGYQAGGPAAGYPPETAPWERGHGVPHQRPAAPGAGEPPDEQPPGYGDRLPRRSPRLLAIIVLALSLSTAGIIMVRGAPVAHAEPEPCPPKRKATPTTTAPALPGPGPTPSATPTPTAGPEGPGEVEDPVGDFFSGIIDGFKDIFGIGDEEDPAAEPSPSATAKPRKPAPRKAPTKPVAPKGEPKAAAPDDKCAVAGRPVPPAKRAAVAPGQPKVGKTPSRLTGSRVTMQGLSFDGVVELPTADGVIRALQFTMDKSVTTDFELRVAGPSGRTLSLKSSALTVEGNVRFFASRFHGTLLGIPLTFTPDSPPPLVLPFMVFGDPDIQLVYVQCDKLTAPRLDTSFG